MAQISRLLRCVRCKMRGCQHSMTIMASASRAVQEPAALAIPVTGPAPAGRSLIAHMPNSGIYAPPAGTAEHCARRLPRPGGGGPLCSGRFFAQGSPLNSTAQSSADWGVNQGKN